MRLSKSREYARKRNSEELDFGYRQCCKRSLGPPPSCPLNIGDNISILKRPECEADHSDLSSTKDNNMDSYICTSSLVHK